jgi:phosphomannomutase
MSNLGLERYINSIGLTLARTAVGDRYVLEHMRQHGYNLGGEQSGHILRICGSGSKQWHTSLTGRLRRLTTLRS